MPIEILMPALSPTMTEGNLAKWLKKEGDEVRSGDVLAEIETDKATMEVEAVDEGRIGKILVPEGAQGVKVNQAIALLLGEGEDASSLSQAPAAKPAPAPENPKTTPAETRPPEPAPHPDRLPAAAGRVGAPRERGREEPAPPSATPAEQRNGARVFASPLARRMAVQAGLDLAALRGTGPQGRIVKADIDAALSGGAPAPVARAPSAPPPAVARAPAAEMTGDAPFTMKPHSAMRRTIARRLTESKQNVPHFYLSIDCRIDEMVRAMKALPEDLRISINDFVIKAAALALRQVPAANASWSEEGIILWERADISVAVALEDGLITPIVRGADRKGIAQISAEVKDLAGRARAGKLKLEEFQGGTFSISNLGMFGVREFSAVINPPQGCILAVGAGEQRPVVRDGQLAVATVMTCTISCDHRVVDGAVGARFMQAFKRLIEQPALMLL
ncbi:MAG TPA: pyruvate dehydrogenase complex dihydrolipoamide acetyltransferase [Stellaceae bacterium]|jgi:pyruvate dehydrogenase E2 component (dihydrolipoamide acetyltransferase)|nr:pyruvate dehydrogenase complex dihydrolipoamide acetyltransferase [Stellaceae bacterium]